MPVPQENLSFVGTGHVPVLENGARCESKLILDLSSGTWRDDRSFKLIASVKPDTRFLYELFETGTRGAVTGSYFKFWGRRVVLNFLILTYFQKGFAIVFASAR